MKEQPRNSLLPPSQGFIKLNTDAAWRSKDLACGGGVFRSIFGSWILGYSSKFNVNTPLAAELYAIREGLVIAKDHMCNKVEIETDALQLKDLLDSVDDYSHHELGPFLREAAQLLQQN
ncbi:uncharacterized protein [Spinacia oleracea]|uniref:RNase H type-1 domain-containing protein n=1 Tax=Spinacia oleracea TaxID=3562 RepID=A0A9R0IPG8_SPIOL|nr:uncharacterized protein LOC110792393 [Spinacia oleracea]